MSTAFTEKQTTAIDVAELIYEARSERAKELDETELPLENVFPAFNRAGLGVVLEYGRMGNRPVSDDLLEKAKHFGAEFEHLALTIGTLIHNVNLKGDLSDEFIAFVRQVLLERKVIFFREQHLTEDQQVRFGQAFGELDAFPFGKAGENPYILEIVHGKNRPGTENSWHTDVTWMQSPSLGSVAQCVELPPTGGDTLFSDSHACYLGMPEALQQKVEHLWGIHDYRIFLGGNLPDELVAEVKARIPYGVKHPILRTHPETGKTGLFIHGGFLRHDSLYDVRTGETLAAEDSQQIVQALLTQHTRPEYQCRFSWQPGSVAFWDNRAVQHYATSDYYPHRRVLRRVTVAGDEPYYDPQSGSK
jgi:taurine dioxygenase